ncbi:MULTISPECIES: hypothetical protein [Photorhabdus]|nr:MULTISPECIES: hypothetical protein [Photorhabdus]
MTGVSECSQQRSNLKDDGYIYIQLDSSTYMGSTVRRKQEISK